MLQNEENFQSISLCFLVSSVASRVLSHRRRWGPEWEPADPQVECPLPFILWHYFMSLSCYSNASILLVLMPPLKDWSYLVTYESKGKGLSRTCCGNRENASWRLSDKMYVMDGGYQLHLHWTKNSSLQWTESRYILIFFIRQRGKNRSIFRIFL